MAGAVAEIHVLLGESMQTVAVAESLTGGLLAAALTETPGASATFRGGVVAYATDLKSRLLGVDADLLRRVGAVDGAVAEALARGVRERLGASWGVGVTGVAGPDPQDGKPVGTVFVAVVGPGRPESDSTPGSTGPGLVESVAALELGGTRNMIRVETVEHAVGLLRAAIIDRARAD